MNGPVRGITPEEAGVTRPTPPPLTAVEEDVVRKLNAELARAGRANIGSRRPDAQRVLTRVQLEYPDWGTELYYIEPIPKASGHGYIKPGGWGLRVWPR